MLHELSFTLPVICTLQLCIISLLQQRASCNAHAPNTDCASVELGLVTPPPTPSLGLPGGSLTPVSECMTPDDCNSVTSDWDPSLDDGKCFLETIVDLLPEEIKVYIVL